MATASTFAIAHDTTFSARCDFIALAYAVNVVSSESGGTTDHTNRLALAQRMIAGRMPPHAWALIVLTSPSIEAAAVQDIAHSGAAVADADIDARIQTFWNAVADALAGLA